MEEQLGKFFSGEATEQEIKEIMRWRNESAENAELFYDTKMVWIGSKEVTTPAPKHIFEEIVADDQTKSTQLWQWVRYAAVVAALIGFAWWFFLRPNTEVLQNDLLPMVEIHQLDDGSQLTLYKGSSFTVREMSDERRVIELSGKAFFEVARDERRPFIVFTEGARVQVLGTSFVIDTKDTDQTEVLVATGVVSMSSQVTAEDEQAEALILEEGDKGILRSGQLAAVKEQIDDANFMAWSSGILAFDQDQLVDVSEVLNEVYGLEVSFNNEEIASCQLTAKYRQKSGAEVVRLIADTFDMKYRITGNQVQFSGRGCQ